MMRTFFLCLVVVAVATTVSSFQPRLHSSSRPTGTGTGTTTTTTLSGIFDGFVKSMEAGYKGDDSAFQKRKAFDEQKRAATRKRAEERKKRGFTELKDVKERTYAKLKNDNVDDDSEEPKDEKKFFGLF